jgi:hypothetical protein
MIKAERAEVELQQKIWEVTGLAVYALVRVE